MHYERHLARLKILQALRGKEFGVPHPWRIAGDAVAGEPEEVS